MCTDRRSPTTSPPGPESTPGATTPPARDRPRHAGTKKGRHSRCRPVRDEWWAILGSNQWPLPCQGSALPLRQSPKRRLLCKRREIVAEHRPAPRACTCGGSRRGCPTCGPPLPVAPPPCGRNRVLFVPLVAEIPFCSLATASEQNGISATRRGDEQNAISATGGGGEAAYSRRTPSITMASCTLSAPCPSGRWSRMAKHVLRSTGVPIADLFDLPTMRSPSQWPGTALCRHLASLYACVVSSSRARKPSSTSALR